VGGRGRGYSRGAQVEVASADDASEEEDSSEEASDEEDSSDEDEASAEDDASAADDEDDAETPATAALISSAVASSTMRFCVKMQPVLSFASSQVLPLPVLSLVLPALNVPALSASVGSPPTAAICLASASVIALFVAAAPADAGSWCWEIAAISGFFALIAVHATEARPTLPVLRSSAR
jgi:hypothetical protein